MNFLRYKDGSEPKIGDRVRIIGIENLSSEGVITGWSEFSRQNAIVSFDKELESGLGTSYSIPVVCLSKMLD